MPMTPEIYCADVGSVARRRFAWFSSRDQNCLDAHEQIETLTERVRSDLASGVPVSLGFECPLYVPIADKPVELTRARKGERDRAWSAGAGCGALATGLVQVVWVLRDIRRDLPSPVPAFLNWQAFCEEGRGLFVWEAFVSGAGKGRSHCEDARAGVEAFKRALPAPDSCLAAGSESHSLVGAALLRTGWSEDLSLLSQPCLVLRGTCD